MKADVVLKTTGNILINKDEHIKLSNTLIQHVSRIYPHNHGSQTLPTQKNNTKQICDAPKEHKTLIQNKKSEKTYLRAMLKINLKFCNVFKLTESATLK
jgi:hypothetical protein